MCRGGRCPLGPGDAGAERLPAGFPRAVGASDSQGRGSARGAAALASEDAPGQCRRPPSAVWMCSGGCGLPPSAVWTSHAVEDAPRRVWTARCGCGRTSAGVEAPSSGEDTPAISSAFPGGSALLLSSSFHRGLFAPACRVSWPGRWDEPRVCRLSATGWWEGPCGRRWVSGRGGRVAPADCAVSHHSADREVSDHLFFPHLIAAKSDLAAVLNEGCVFPTVSGHFAFLFLGLVGSFP